LATYFIAVLPQAPKTFAGAGRMTIRKGANSIPIIIGTDKSDFQLCNILFNILKAHLIYRMSFFVFYPSGK
jgi:hypothetical protein